MVAYADTSFLLSLHTADANHEAATRLFQRGKAVLPFTPLQRHEVRNALRLQVFRNILHVAAARIIGMQEFLTFDTRQRTLAVNRP